MATPGPWERDGRIVYALTHYGYRNGIEQRANKVTISVQKGHDCSAEEADAVALHIATFDPRTVFALLDEIERLRREREVLAEVLRHVHTCDHCECALCPEGTELSYRAYRAVSKSELLAGEEGADGVTHFALYHPDFNWWECQACR